MISGDADLAVIGSLLAEPARARVLQALADGRELPASMLAAEAGVSAATISEHLRKLLERRPGAGDGTRPVPVLPAGRPAGKRPAGGHGPGRPGAPGHVAAGGHAGQRATPGAILLRPPGRPPRRGADRRFPGQGIPGRARRERRPGPGGRPAADRRRPRVPPPTCSRTPERTPCATSARSHPRTWPSVAAWTGPSGATTWPASSAAFCWSSFGHGTGFALAAITARSR